MPREMKDSGIEWIGEIPQNWICKKTKYILSSNDGGVWGNEPIGDESDKIVIRSIEQTIDGEWCITNPATRDLSSVDHKTLRIKKDDLLITKSSGSDLHIGKTTIADSYFDDHECYFSNFLQRIRCQSFSPRLMWYLFNSSIVREQCVYLQNSTSGLGNINAEIIRNLSIPIPSDEEQQRIVAFLDAECARIDAVMEQTRASIEEYKKLKQAIITEAVTKGIRKNRPMKDSGIEWIGEIPVDWEARPIKNSFIIVSGATPKSDNPDYWDGEVVWVTPADYKFEDKYITSGKRNLTQAGYDSCGTTLVPSGSLVFSKRAPIGTVAMTSCSLCTNQGCLACIPKSGISVLYFYYTMAAYCEQFNLYGTGTTFKEISFTAFSDFKLPLPPFEEQEEIATWLESKCDEIDNLITAKQQILNELDNFKKSIIYEYVTGKKEVPYV